MSTAATFALRPFPSAAAPPGIGVTGWIERRGERIAVHYRLRGKIRDVALPAPAAPPARRFGLWETTCFELFLAPRGRPRYWEFNLSPSGDWNVFRFAEYREGMLEETDYEALPVSVRRSADSLSLRADFALPGAMPAGGIWQAGISAVIVDESGAISYWALSHRGEMPDFHLRGSFTVDLPPGP